MKTQLENKLTDISTVFDIEAVVNRTTDLKEIVKYYKVNRMPYSVFHSKEGFVHVGISKEGKFQKDDLLALCDYVSDYIKKTNATDVLELATGKGASSEYLAKIYSQVSFTGLDLPGGQISVAYKKAKKLENFEVFDGDFHYLERFKDESFDIVFIFEALCYSTDKKRVAEEVRRVLKLGGIFIIADAYMTKDEELLEDHEKLAKKLTEKGMAVESFESYPAVKEKTIKSGFTLEKEDNVTSEIIPTLKRFEYLAWRSLFKRPKRGQFIYKHFPRNFTYNAISGYLMPELVNNGMACYYVSVFKKV